MSEPIISQQDLFKAFKNWIDHQAQTEHRITCEDISDEEAQVRAFQKWINLTGWGGILVVRQHVRRTSLYDILQVSKEICNLNAELPKDSGNRVQVPIKIKEDQAVTTEEKPHFSVPVPRTVHRSYNGPTLYELADMQAKARENQQK